MFPTLPTISCAFSQLYDWFQREIMFLLFLLLCLPVFPSLLMTLLTGRPVMSASHDSITSQKFVHLL